MTHLCSHSQLFTPPETLSVEPGRPYVLPNKQLSEPVLICSPTARPPHLHSGRLDGAQSEVQAEPRALYRNHL